MPAPTISLTRQTRLSRPPGSADGDRAMIRAFCVWLAATPLSVMIGSTRWVVPMVQTLHILAIAVVLSSVLMLELRVLELAGRSQSVMQAARRFLPWLLGGLAVLAMTGALLIVSEPQRSLVNSAFWTKMCLLALAVTAIFRLQRAQWRIVASQALLWPAAVARRATAVIPILLWLRIVEYGPVIDHVHSIS